MSRNIFYDKINTAYGKMSFQLRSFEEILNYLKLRNCRLNSIYFSLRFTFLLPLFPGATIELENSVFQ